MLEAALEYIRHGWSIFPLKEAKDGKHGTPHIEWAEFQERIPTEDEVREWWTRWPTANIAIICGRISGVVTVDIDPRKGGKESGLPDTGCVARTGGGGFHYFYQYPKDSDGVPNQVNDDDCPDLERRGRDVRADGGYVIAAPSVHHSGRQYSWRSFEPDSLGVPPDWSLAPLRPKDDGAKDPWLTRLIEGGTRPGKRNDDLARFAGYLASKGVPSDVGLALSRQWMAGQAAPLHDGEVEVTVRSVYRTEARRNPKRKIKKETARKLFKTLTLNQFMREYGDNETSWLVEDWVPEQTIGFIASPPGGFKTWLTFDLGASIASGKPFLGRFPVWQPGPVLIVQQEDNNKKTAERNALVLLNRLGMKPPKLIEGDLCDVPLMPDDSELPLHFHAERMLRFNDTQMMDALEAFVEEIKPKLVVVDPFYSTVPTDEYMAKAASDMARLKTMRDQHGTSFLMVHHTTKTEEWGRHKLWGSQFLNAFAETTWHVRRPEGEKFNVIQRYFKGEDVQDFVKCTFDIRVPDYHYSVNTETISKEEAESIVKTGGSGDKKTFPTGLPKQVLDLLAKLEEGVSSKQIAKQLDTTESKVKNALRRLCSKGDVQEDAVGRWTHAVKLPI